MPKLLTPTNVKIKNHSEGAVRFSAARKMNLHLKKVFQSWCQGAQQLTKNELEVRYQWSQDLLRVCGDGDKYGSVAADLLFEAMGIDRNEQVYYRNVGRQFTREHINEIHEFNQQTESRYGRITWSHVRELSRLAHESDHKKLLKQAMNERWSVATLHEHVSKLFEVNPKSARTEIRETGPLTIAKQLQRSVNGTIKAGNSVISDSFRDGLSKIRNGKRQESEEALQEVRATVVACRDQMDGFLKALDEAIELLDSEEGDEDEVEDHPLSERPPAKQVESKRLKQRPRDPSKIRLATSASPPAKKKLKKISNKVRKKREPVLAA